MNESVRKKIFQLGKGVKKKIFRYLNNLNTPEFHLSFLDDAGFQECYFIDCGANNGCSVRKFRNEIDLDNRYHIYSFEPNPAFSDCFDKFENHTFIPKAVWTENGKLSFYDSLQNDKYGGTVCDGKSSGNVDYSHPLEVDAINFPSWVMSTFTDKDFIILKLDIEGAEYEVLTKMLMNGSLDKVNLLFIEWHVEKIDVDIKVHKNLVQALKSRKITPYDWHAAEYI
jgi:FkbM family methyltransferase